MSNHKNLENSELQERQKYKKCINKNQDRRPYFGQYGCDTPENLFKMYFEQMKDEVKAKNVTAVIFLGDLIAHQENLSPSLDLTKSDILELLYHLKLLLHNLCNKYFSQVYNTDGVRVPVYMNIGNHDTLVNHEAPNVQSDSHTRDYYGKYNITH